MKSFEVKPASFRVDSKKILLVRVECDCGADYLAEPGGSIAAEHQIGAKEVLDEIWSCNYCGRNYRVEAKHGHIKISHGYIKISPEKRTRIKRSTL